MTDAQIEVEHLVPIVVDDLAERANILCTDVDSLPDDFEDDYKCIEIEEHSRWVRVALLFNEIVPNVEGGHEDEETRDDVGGNLEDMD